MQTNLDNTVIVSGKHKRYDQPPDNRSYYNRALPSQTMSMDQTRYATPAQPPKPAPQTAGSWDVTRRPGAAPVGNGYGGAGMGNAGSMSNAAGPSRPGGGSASGRGGVSYGGASNTAAGGTPAQGQERGGLGTSMGTAMGTNMGTWMGGQGGGQGAQQPSQQQPEFCLLTQCCFGTDQVDAGEMRFR